jgi:hypothetical protein
MPAPKMRTKSINFAPPAPHLSFNPITAKNARRANLPTEHHLTKQKFRNRIHKTPQQPHKHLPPSPNAARHLTHAHLMPTARTRSYCQNLIHPQHGCPQLSFPVPGLLASKPLLVYEHCVAALCTFTGSIWYVHNAAYIVYVHWPVYWHYGGQ